MAAAARAATTSLYVPWHRLLPHLRTTRPFSAAASPPPASSSPNPTKTKKRKKKNLIEVANFLPNWGIGYHMAKTHWTNVSYQITKINLYKAMKDGRHGKAWGVAFKDGVPADAPKKISGVHKRCWRYLPRPPKAVEAQPKAESQAA